MQAVLRKAWADLRGRAWQSALILMTVAAAATLFYLGLVTLTTVSAPYEKLMDRARGAHVYLLLSGADAGKALAREMAIRPDVSELELRPSLMTTLKLTGKDRPATVILMEVGAEQPDVMGYVVVEGRGLKENDQDAAVLAVSMARFFGITVGDQVEAVTPTGLKPFRVVGLHADPMWCSFPTCDLQNMYVPAGSGATGSGDQWMLGMRLTEPESANEMLTLAQEAAGEARILTAWSWLDVREGIKLLQGLSVISVLLFAAVAIAAAALITANIIGGAVLGQYREIAVLKVLGMTRRQVLGLYLGQNLLLGLAGAALGVVAGHGVVIQALRALSESMGNPDVMRFQPLLALIVVACVLAVSGIFTALAAWRAVALLPAGVLQAGFSAPRARTGLAVRVMAALGAPAPVLLGVKDATARPGRAAMTVASVMLCLVTIAVSAGINGFVGQIQDDPAVMGIPFDMTVSTQTRSTEDLETAIAGLPGAELFCRQASASVLAPDQRVTFSLRALGENWQAFGFQVVQGRLPAGPGELALAPGTVEHTGVKIGEKLRLRINGREASLTVVGEYRDPFNLGMMGLTTLESLQAIWPEAPVQQMLVNATAASGDKALGDAILAAAGSQVSVTLTRAFMLPTPIVDLLARMRTLSLLMAGIAALSLLNSALLTAREQMREVGIRKALGMTPVQILGAVAAGGACLGLVGAVLGVPAGVMLTRGLVGTLAETYGYGRVVVGLSPLTAGLLLTGGAALAAVAWMPAAAWAGRLSAAEVLASE